MYSIHLRTSSFRLLHISGIITNIKNLSLFNFNYQCNKEFIIDYKNLIYSDVFLVNILLWLYSARAVN